MSEIKIKGQDLKNIDQSNFQSVGPYTDPSKTQVKEPWQGRYIINNNETDDRFSLGTYTENNREFWELQTLNPITRKSQFESLNNQTARIKIKNNLPVSDEVNWSVDTFPFVVNQNNNETVPLYFYYDDKLHSSEYNSAVNGKVNLRIELREDGRNNDGIIDNFLLREAYRPFVVYLKIKSNEGGDGEYRGDGAFKYGDLFNINATPNDTSYFEYFQDGDDDSIISYDGDYTFTMPRKDLEILVNFRANPNIILTGRKAGNFDAGNLVKILITDIDLTTAGLPDGRVFYTYTNYKTDDLMLISPTDQSVVDGGWDSEDETQLIRPNQTVTVAAIADDRAQVFEKFTMIRLNDNGTTTQVDLPGEIKQQVNVSETELDEYNPSSTGNLYTQLITLENRPDYPNGVFQIYANFTNEFYFLRNYNAEVNASSIEDNPEYHTLDFRLNEGYGDVQLFNFNEELYPGAEGTYSSFNQTIQYPLYTPQHIQTNPSDGYISDEWFWYDQDFDGDDPNGFDEELQARIITLSDDESEWKENLEDSFDNNVNNRKYLSFFEALESSQIEELIGAKDKINVIGHTFKQLGTYIKITQADGSANFDIDVSPNPVNIIRDEELSPEIDAHMYQIAPDLELTWFIGVSPSLSELPTIQGIDYWLVDENGEDAELSSTNDPADIGITLDTEGGNNSGTVEPNQLILNYTTPSSIESDNYYKYINIRLFSEMILQPFLGVFEINFSSNSENLGTVSFLEQAPEIPQTTIIGLFGNENARETPTHAIDMDTWHDGDTSGIIPIPLDIDINAVDTELGTLTTTRAPNFQSRVVEILSNSYFDNYSDSEKGIIIGYLTGLTGMGNYLNLQIIDNNSFSIEPDTTTDEAIRDVLTFVEQNNDVPRLPLRITGFFVQMFTLTINSFPVFNNENSYPTKFITNWDQDAYDENSTLNAADTWLNDELLETTFANMSEESLQISIPPAFFNGSRELKIIQQIPPQSEADQGTELFFSGTSDPTVYTNEISTFRYRHRIVDMDSSATINLNWVGGF